MYHVIVYIANEKNGILFIIMSILKRISTPIIFIYLLRDSFHSIPYFVLPKSFESTRIPLISLILPFTNIISNFPFQCIQHNLLFYVFYCTNTSILYLICTLSLHKKRLYINDSIDVEDESIDNDDAGRSGRSGMI